ncbi:unnamed protein product, partial [Prunus brigantina]
MLEQEELPLKLNLRSSYILHLSSTIFNISPSISSLLLFHHVIVVIIIIIIFIVVVVVWFGLEIFDLLLQLCVSL